MDYKIKENDLLLRKHELELKIKGHMYEIKRIDQMINLHQHHLEMIMQKMLGIMKENKKLEHSEEKN